MLVHAEDHIVRYLPWVLSDPSTLDHHITSVDALLGPLDLPPISSTNTAAIEPSPRGIFVPSVPAEHLGIIAVFPAAPPLYAQNYFVWS
jgi:hypothetical protein